MRIAALDIGDVWTGIAISDPLGIIAKPYTTIQANDLTSEISNLTTQEAVKTIIIGYPKTMRGTRSEQTKKIEDITAMLQEEFPSISFILWDERLSSKRADSVKKGKTRQEKLASHAIAAAFILQIYLDHRSMQQ